MKTLILASDAEKSVQNCTDFLLSIGSEIIAYKWPLKAIDNIDEIKPHLILIDVDSFPRLWKTVTQFVNADKNFDNCFIVLVSKDSLSEEENKKAKALNIDLVLNKNMNEPEKKRLHTLLSNEGLISKHITQNLIFKHPQTYNIITGQIACMFSSVIIFHPDNPLLTENIKIGTIIKSCTLTVGQAVIEPLLKVVKNVKTEIQFQIL